MSSSIVRISSLGSWFYYSSILPQRLRPFWNLNSRIFCLHAFSRYLPLSNLKTCRSSIISQRPRIRPIFWVVLRAWGHRSIRWSIYGLCNTHINLSCRVEVCAASRNSPPNFVNSTLSLSCIFRNFMILGGWRFLGISTILGLRFWSFLHKIQVLSTCSRLRYRGYVCRIVILLGHAQGLNRGISVDYLLSFVRKKLVVFVTNFNYSELVKSFVNLAWHSFYKIISAILAMIEHHAHKFLFSFYIVYFTC